MNEQKAIRLCLTHRDPAGFEALVDQNQRRAFFHAHALLGNHEDAADACQESFTRAFAALPRMTVLDQFYPWFYQILRNVCLNMLARKKTRNTYLQNPPSDKAELSHHQSPVQLIEASESRAQVWRLLNLLSPDHREILTLKYIHGFTYDEIATTLEIARGTVMSRLYSARQSFRLEYEKANSHRNRGTDHEFH